jgi:large subunit ribosomal protein L6
MSRVGKEPIKIAQGVKVQVSGAQLNVEGPKGKLSMILPKNISINQDKEVINVVRANDEKETASLHGTTRSLLRNMVVGVSEGFKRELDIIGVGYRAAVKGDTLTLNLGYSHQVEYKLPKGINCVVDKNTHLVLTGSDKMLLGMVASKIRSFREPEPYQGKGVKYTEERIIRKQGKSAGAK